MNAIWLRRFFGQGAGNMPDNLVRQQEEHVKVLRRAIVVLEKYDGDTPRGDRALRELRALEVSARRR